MFTWMYSKVSNLFVAPVTAGNIKAEINRKLCSTNFCLQAIKTPVITSAAEKKMEIKTSNSSWLTTQMRNIYNSLPSITLTGSGFAINGLNFDLRNVPKNLKNNLMFLVSLFLVAKTKADIGNFYFMDPTNSSDYKLYVNEGCVDIRANQVATNIMNACNATSRSPFSFSVDLIHAFEACGSPIGFREAQYFYRAVNETVYAAFESCITRNMGTPSPNGPFKWELLLEVLGAMVGGVLLFIGADQYCRKEKFCCYGRVPLYLFDPQKAQHKKHGDVSIENDVARDKKEDKSVVVEDIEIGTSKKMDIKDTKDIFSPSSNSPKSNR